MGNKKEMQLPDNLPDGVATPLRRLLIELGKETFSINDVIGHIERKRQKVLRIEEDDMPAGMTGYVVALLDCDLICTRRNLSTTQRLVSQLHEMAHFIRDDIPILSAGAKTSTYKEFISSRDRHKLVEARERIFEMYGTPQEHNTELLARMLLQYIREHEKNMPQSARQMYSLIRKRNKQ